MLSHWQFATTEIRKLCAHCYWHMKVSYENFELQSVVSAEKGVSEHYTRDCSRLFGTRLTQGCTGSRLHSARGRTITSSSLSRPRCVRIFPSPKLPCLLQRVLNL